MRGYADLLLHRIDLSINMRRFYRIRLCRNLFGEPLLMREFGRIGHPGRVIENRHHAAETAMIDFCRLAAVKLRRGYICISPDKKGNDVAIGILLTEPVGYARDLIFGSGRGRAHKEFDFICPRIVGTFGEEG